MPQKPTTLSLVSVGLLGVVAAAVFMTRPVQAAGLLAEYYNLAAPQTSPPVPSGVLALTRVDSSVDFDWGDSPGAGVNADGFIVIWRGYVQATATDTYTFWTESDDGVRLWVNGVLVVDSWVDQGPTWHSGTIALTAGNYYTVRMEMYENGGGAVARLYWERTGAPGSVVIPSSQLYPEPVAPTIAPAAGSYTNAVQVTMSTISTGATIRYRTDGVNPGPGDTAYTGPFWLGTSAQVRAATFSPPPNSSAVTSADYTITDSTPPTLVSASAANPSDVLVTFSEGVTQPSAENVNNYSINNGIGTPLAAVLQPDQLAVILTTTGLAGGTTYTLTVSNILDRATPANTINPNPSTANFSLTGSGLLGEYYNDRAAPVLTLTRIDPTVDFDWGNGSPGGSVWTDNFLVIWRGSVMAIETGNYLFHTISDDGVRLYVNGQLAINQWVDRGAGAWDVSPQIALTGGQLYDIRMEMYENGGGAVARLGWTRPGFGSPAVIPQAQLFPTVATPTITPSGGSFTDTIVISMSAVTQGATIRYTLDGSVPTAASTLYTGPFPRSSSVVVRARAFCAGLSDSAFATANLTINDTTRPTIVSCEALDPTVVKVVFSEPLDVASAQTATNYSIDGGIGNPGSAVLGADFKTVTLNLGPALTAGQTYTLTVNNVADTAPVPNTVLPNTQRVFTYLTFQTANLEMWLRLDEGTGLAANDSTVNAHNGTLTNGPQWTQGMIGSGLQFDGSNDIVTVPNHVNFQFEAFGSFSMAAWVYIPVGFSGTQAIMSKSREAAAWYGLYAVAGWGWAFTGTASDLYSTGAVTSGWHHVAGVQDGVAGTRTIYVDGVAGGTGTAQAGDGGGALWIGGANSVSNYFQGTIDDVRLYSNRALTLADIQRLANRAPVVNAGPDQVVSMPPGTATLNGTVSDDGFPTPVNLTTTWVVVSGPGAVGFNPSANVLNPTASFGAAGLYVLRLIANDGQRAASDDMTVRVNTAPVANNDAYGTNEDAGVLTVPAPGVLTNDTDAELDPLTAVLATGLNPAASGSLVLNADGSFTFTPAADWNGVATFTYFANDGFANSGTAATVTITVTAVNDPPSFTKGADQVVLEDAGAQTVNGWATAISAGPANESAQTLTFNITGNTNPALFSAAPAVDPATGNLSYTPAANANGTATITLVLQDNGGGLDTSPPQSFTITVTAVNDAPSFTKGADQTVAEDSGAQTVAGWATAISAGPANEAGQTLTFNVTGNTNPALFSAGPAVNAATGNLTYTPAANANGSATITLVLQDNGGGADTSPPQSFTINVTPVNDPPVANNDSYTVVQPRVLTVAAPGVLANDTDVEITRGELPAQTLTATLVAGPAVGVLAFNADGSFTYTPPPPFTGVVTFTYQANDGTLNSNVATVTINVVPNIPPVATNDAYTTPENTPLTVVAPGVLANDTDANGDPLTAVPGPGPSNGALALNADGSFTYTPNLNYHGPDSFTYTASDGLAGSNIATVTLTVTPVNAPPVAFNQNLTTAEATPLNITLTGDDGDPEDVQALTFAIAVPPAHGTLTNLDPATGAVTYTPDPAWHGTDTFTFTVTDDAAAGPPINLTSVPGTVTITVTPVNDPPMAFAQTVNTAENAAIVITLMGDDGDSEDVQALTFALGTQPTHGTLSGFNPVSGQVTYTPTQYYSGDDSFTFTVTDDGAAGPPANLTSAPATVTIHVGFVNQAPVANPQSVVTGIGTPVQIVLTGSDVENSPLTFAIATPPSHGALSGGPAMPTYTPAPGFLGTDSFTFTVMDTGVPPLTSAPATVTITVAPAPTFSSTPTIVPVPVVMGQPLTCTAGTTGTATITWNFGDGTQTTGASVTHTYTLPGIFTVTVTASSPEGLPTVYQTEVFVGMALVGTAPTGVTGGAALPPGATGILVGGAGIGSELGGTGKIICNYAHKERTGISGSVGGIGFPATLQQAQLAGQPGILTLGRGATAQTFVFTLGKTGRGKATSLPGIEVNLKKKLVRFKANNRPALTDMIEALGGTWLRDTKKGPVVMMSVPATLQVGNSVFLAMTFQMEYHQIGTSGIGTLAK